MSSAGVSKYLLCGQIPSCQTARRDFFAVLRIVRGDRAEGCIPAPCKQGILCFIGIYIRDFAQIKIVIADGMVFFQSADDGKSCVNRYLDIGSADGHQINTKLCCLVCLSGRGCA